MRRAFMELVFVSRVVLSSYLGILTLSSSRFSTLYRVKEGQEFQQPFM